MSIFKYVTRCFQGSGKELENWSTDMLHFYLYIPVLKEVKKL